MHLFAVEISKYVPAIVVGIIVLFILIIIFCFIGLYNKLKRLKVTINESASDIDVALTKRHDCLKKAVDLLKSYTKYESTTLKDVVSMRPSMSISQKASENEKMDTFFRGFYAVAEQYPDLKANQMCIELMSQIKDVEEHLQAARRLFNHNVATYNKVIAVFPNSIIAGMFHFEKEALFEATEEQKQDVDMKF